MAAPRKLPDVQTLLTLVDQGMTNEEIGQRYGVSRQAVTMALRGHRETRSNRRAWPWDVETRHKAGWLYNGLAYYVISRTHERTLLDREKQRLNSFTESIEKLGRRTGKRWVVDYNPESAEGFYLRPARKGDPEDSVMGAPETAQALTG